MVRKAALSRRLALLSLLVLLGFLRAEQGVAELQGRAGEPSRVFRLVPAGNGYWSYAFVGLEGQAPGEILIYDRGQPLLTSRDLSGLSQFLAGATAHVVRQWDQIRKALP